MKITVCDFGYIDHDIFTVEKIGIGTPAILLILCSRRRRDLMVYSTTDKAVYVDPYYPKYKHIGHIERMLLSDLCHRHVDIALSKILDRAAYAAINMEKTVRVDAKGNDKNDGINLIQLSYEFLRS